MTDPRTELVGRGYDVIGERFVEWRDRVVGDPRRGWMEALTSQLPDDARVLELGCGAGVPDTQILAERLRVTGVDISREQIRRARENVPNASFVEADFTSLELEPASFEAVAAFYSLNRVPREFLASVFAHVHEWLAPKGFFLVSLGAGDIPGWTGDFLGAPTYFSGYPPETNRRLLDEAGFQRLLDDVVTFMEPDGEASFHWILAQT